MRIPNESLRALDIPDESNEWYVHYESDEDAGRALDRTEHSINRKKILVEAAESWLQYEKPDPNVRIRTLARQAAATTDENANYGPQLNADCWEQICKYLPLSDLCAVADTCVAAEEGATRIAKRKVHKTLLTFTMYQNTMLNARAMAIFGENITSIEVHSHLKHRGVEFDLKAKFFHNLIDCFGTRVESLRWPCGDMSNRTEFGQLKQLKRIHIDGDYIVWNTGATMKCLQWTEELELSNVTFNDAIWWQLQCRMPRLYSLRVNQSIGFSMAELSEVQSLQKIWLLRYDQKTVLEHVASIPNLEFMCLYKTNSLINTTEYLQIVDAFRRNGRHLTIHQHTCCAVPTIAPELLEAYKNVVELVFKGHGAERSTQ